MPAWWQKLAGPDSEIVPASLDEQLNLLVRALRQRRSLLVLENFEGVMAGAVAEGDLLHGAAQEFQPGYEAYSRLLQEVGQLRHQSCLLLTSRAHPRAIQQLAAGANPVYVLRLSNDL